MHGVQTVALVRESNAQFLMYLLGIHVLKLLYISIDPKFQISEIPSLEALEIIMITS